MFSCKKILSVFIFTGITVITQSSLAMQQSSSASVEVGGKDLAQEIWDAVAQNKIDVVKELLKKGADVNAKNECGDTLLIRAFSDANEDMTNLLLENGADLNAKGREGNTLLHTAVLRRECLSPQHVFSTFVGSEAVVKFLLEKRADVNAKDKGGNTPLLKVIGIVGTIEVVKLLLNSGADVNAKDSYGRMPLHIAIAELCRNTEVKKYLSTKMIGEYLISPYKSAISEGKSIIKLLLEKGADVNAKCNGSTPLDCINDCITAGYGNTKQLKELKKLLESYQ